ncbi:hypothetical protein Tco_0949556 [Tanacetum coccineum]
MSIPSLQPCMCASAALLECFNGGALSILANAYDIKYSSDPIIMEYLVKISKKARILELKRRHLKITVLTSNTPYPSRKIRRICACTSLKTTKEQDPIRRLRKKYRLSLKNDMPPRDK